MVGPRLPLGEDLVVGHVHARGAADTEGSSLSPRIKRRIRAKTSLAEIERKERGRTNIPGPPRLRTLVADAAEVPISEGSLVPASTPPVGHNEHILIHQSGMQWGVHLLRWFHL